MKKKKLIVLLFLFIGLRVYAVEEQKYLIVSMTDGESDIILLEHKPTIFYNKAGDEDYWLIINGTENVLFEYIYPLDMIKEIVFSDDVSDVNEITLANPRYKISSEGRGVSIEGVSDGEPIKVYDMNGVNLHADIEYSDGGAKLSFSSVPRGIYVISISDKEKFKINIK